MQHRCASLSLQGPSMFCIPVQLLSLSVALCPRLARDWTRAGLGCSCGNSERWSTFLSVELARLELRHAQAITHRRCGGRPREGRARSRRSARCPPAVPRLHALLPRSRASSQAQQHACPHLAPTRHVAAGRTSDASSEARHVVGVVLGRPPGPHLARDPDGAELSPDHRPPLRASLFALSTPSDRRTNEARVD